LPRPRNRIEVAETHDYNHARAEVLHFLHQRFSNPVDLAA
jgi:nitrate/nitrite transport system ATP-binding protein